MVIFYHTDTDKTVSYKNILIVIYTVVLYVPGKLTLISRGYKALITFANYLHCILTITYNKSTFKHQSSVMQFKSLGS